MLMRPVRSAICTSGEPVSVSWRRYSLIVAEVSGISQIRSLPARCRMGMGDLLTRASGLQPQMRRPPSLPSVPSGPRTGFEQPAGGVDVTVHGRHQRVDGIEALFGPDPFDEPDRRRLTVEVAAPVEQVGL